jgi:ABC-type branched-subunit amino acid transport system substrate-binding protein
VPSALADAIVAKLGKEHVKTWTYAGAAVASAEGSQAASEEDRARQRAAAMEEMAKDVQAHAPRTILVLGTAGDCLQLRAALRKAGVDSSVPFLFGGGEDSLTALAASGPPAEGIYAVTTFCLDSHSPRALEIARNLPRAQTFLTTYQARFGEAPDAHAALAYDGVRFLFEAMRAARGFDGEKVEEQLSGLQNDFETLTGPLPRRPAFLVQIKGGRPELLEMYPAP